MTSTDLVGPLPTVTFHGGPGRHDPGEERPKVAYTPPRNSIDPRFRACTDHHVACDCREALWAEEREEARGERRFLQELVNRVLAGHPTFAYDRDGNECGCRCTGCQLVREACLPYPEGAWRL